MPILNNISTLSGGVGNLFVNNLNNGSKYRPFDVGAKDSYIVESTSAITPLSNDSCCSTVTSWVDKYANLDALSTVLYKNYATSGIYKAHYMTKRKMTVEKIIDNSVFTNTYLLDFIDIQLNKHPSFYAVGINNQIIGYNTISTNKPTTYIPANTKFNGAKGCVFEMDSQAEGGNFCAVYLDSGRLACERVAFGSASSDYEYEWIGTPVYTMDIDFAPDEIIMGLPWVDRDYNMSSSYIDVYYFYIAVYNPTLNTVRIIRCLFDDNKSNNKIFKLSQMLEINNLQFSCLKDLQITGAMYNDGLFGCIFNAVIGDKLQWFRVVVEDDITVVQDPKYTVEQIGDNNYIMAVHYQGLYNEDYVPFLNSLSLNERANYVTGGYMISFYISTNSMFKSNNVYPVGQSSFKYFLYNNLISNDDMIYICAPKDSILNISPYDSFYLLIPVDVNFPSGSLTTYMDSTITLVHKEYIKTVRKSIFSTQYKIPYDCIISCSKNAIYSLER